ncbi:Importin-11 [Labeo rohita]|uniref:Importin-11 n=1 Tax=Labeo rohita TaxID=84645 RepID=A0ABQ8MF77_LABRO|nr:Importin-11 [Labeo rohita]
MDIQSASSVVLQALTQATSQDTAVLKPAEEQLRQWETQPGFYSVLLRMRCLWTLRPGQYNPSRSLRGAQQHPCCHTALTMVV